jgi:hypothetical protein
VPSRLKTALSVCRSCTDNFTCTTTSFCLAGTG